MMQIQAKYTDVLVKKKVKSYMARSLPASGESTTTECGVNYQLPAVIY